MVQRHGLSGKGRAGDGSAGSARTGLVTARGARRLGLLGLVLAVSAVHGCVSLELSHRMAEMVQVARMPPRIEVAYVRDLMPTAPPAIAPRPAPSPTPSAKPVRRKVAAPIAAPASAASSAASVAASSEAAAAESVDVAVLRDEQNPVRTEPVEVPASAPAMPTGPDAERASTGSARAESAERTKRLAERAESLQDAPSPGASPFEWPASTRLSYKLTGNVRGEVNGEAQVEWVRSGGRYQVHLDVIVGLPIAPLITRRMSSDGELTEQGLTPQRYDEDTKVMFRDRRRVTMLFERDAVVLPSGERRERWPGMQDTASQFVQLSWLFSTRPELLRAGGTVELPLALPRSVDRWVYDVIGEETVYTTFGELPAFHLKPRRVSRPGGELSAEIWFAPQLRYLPVRIRIHQDADTFIDLLIARRPELAGP